MGDTARVGRDPLTRRIGRLLTEPALPIMLLIVVAMLRRKYLPDILLTTGTCLALVVDSGRWGFRTASAAPRARSSITVPVVAVTGVLALGMASLPRVSTRIDLAFACVGVVAVVAAWLPRTPASHAEDPPPLTRWWVWPSLAVGLALVMLYSFLHQAEPMVDDPDHPTVSNLTEPMLGPWPTRALYLWLWLLAGWWLLRRIRAWAEGEWAENDE